MVSVGHRRSDWITCVLLFCRCVRIEHHVVVWQWIQSTIGFWMIIVSTFQTVAFSNALVLTLRPSSAHTHTVYSQTQTNKQFLTLKDVYMRWCCMAGGSTVHCRANTNTYHPYKSINPFSSLPTTTTATKTTTTMSATNSCSADIIGKFIYDTKWASVR